MHLVSSFKLTMYKYQSTVIRVRSMFAQLFLYLWCLGYVYNFVNFAILRMLTGLRRLKNQMFKYFFCLGQLPTFSL